LLPLGWTFAFQESARQASDLMRVFFVDYRRVVSAL